MGRSVPSKSNNTVFIISLSSTPAKTGSPLKIEENSFSQAVFIISQRAKIFNRKKEEKILFFARILRLFAQILQILRQIR
jgi:hypothetical protein